LDSTIYDGHVDYKILNTASYPIIVVANYDGTSGGTEEVFSLAKTEHKGSFEHDYARPNSTYITEK
jgi:vancomycin resistance protein YoaR